MNDVLERISFARSTRTRTLVVPIVALAGVIVGAVLATKRGRGSMGATITICSILAPRNETQRDEGGGDGQKPHGQGE